MRLFRLDPLRAFGLLGLAIVLSIPFESSSQTAPTPPLAMTDTRKQPGPELTEIIFNHVREGHVEPVRLYLESGYTPNAVNARGDSLLILAAYKGHADLVKLLLSQPGVQVDYQNKMGFTALTGASFRGDTGIMQQLLDAGAKVNHRNASGQTALMFAALTGRFSAVKLLLKHRADARAHDTAGNTAALLAEQQGASEVADLLKPVRP